MAHINGEIVINRPVEEVFDLWADARNEPLYNPRLRRTEQLSPGPIGPGTRFRTETLMLGRPVATVIEHTAYERPRRLATAIHAAAMESRGVLTFDPAPGGTRVRWSWELQPRGAFKLFTPFMARLGGRLEASVWAGFKRFLETRAAPVPHA